MTVPPVQPAMGLSDVLLFLPRVVIGAVRGVGAGIAARGGTITAAAGTDAVFSQAVVRDFVAGKVMSPAIAELTAPGAAAQGFAGIRTAGLKAGFDGFLKSLAATGPRGLVLMGIIGVGAVAATAMGWTLFRDAQNKLHDLSVYGSTIDYSNSSTIHTGRLLSGAGMLGGGILSLLPGGAAIGIPLMALSGATGAGLHAVRYIEGGAHIGRNADIAPWPLNLVLRPFSGSQNVFNV